MDWQLQREMSPKEYREAIKRLGLSRAAAGRFLGVSARTSYRYGNGDAEIPVAQVLLLRAMLILYHLGTTPVAPPWRKGQN